MKAGEGLQKVYGRNPVCELLRAGRRTAHKLLIAEGAAVKGTLAEAVRLARKAGIPIERLPRKELDRQAERHQGVVALVDPYPYVDLQAILDRAEQAGEPPLVLFLDLLQDPHNLGALLRSAAAVGVHGVGIPFRRGVGVTSAVVSASAGMSEQVWIAQGNLAQMLRTCKQAELWIVGLESREGLQTMQEIDLRGPLGLVVGGEAGGMRRLVREACDYLVRLPMRREVESLNASVAGSIALYTIWAARGYPGA